MNSGRDRFQDLWYMILQDEEWQNFTFKGEKILNPYTNSVLLGNLYKAAYRKFKDKLPTHVIPSSIISLHFVYRPT